MSVRARPSSILAATVLAALAAAVPAASASDADPVPAAPRAAPSPVGIVRTAPAGGTVAVRRSPVAPDAAGVVRDGDNFVVRCQVNGDKQAQKFGVSRLWNQIQLPDGQIAYLPGAATDLSIRSVMVAPYCGWKDATRVGGTRGQCFRRSPVALVRPYRSRAAFLRKAGPAARRSSKASGVPASVELAQAILESDSGRATAGANNYFGIKAEQVDPVTGAFAWGSRAIGCVNVPTFETEGGTPVRLIAQFRLYRTLRASFLDHGRFLRENPRYASAFRYRRSPKRFARAIAKAGYATDPHYASKLNAIIRGDRLTRFDR